MWRPAERIKYQPNPGSWPSADQARTSLLFSPIALGPLTLSQRTWVPAMVPWRATEEGFVSPDVIDWYRRFAEGKPGAIVVEATGIRDVPSGPLLRIGHDRFVPGLEQLVKAVREASGGETRLLIQLIDFLRINRRPTKEKFFGRYLEISDDHRKALGESLSDDEVRGRLLELDDEALREILSARELSDLEMGYRERVNDLHLRQVRELPDVLPGLFADAAVRARRAGFDGVELHYAHAYTMASFLSARNTREDGYGGPRENRVRLPLEVYATVRRAVGDDFAVGCRYLADEIIERGSGVEDAAYFGTEFARAGMDFLSLSRGGKFEDAKQPKVGAAAYPYTGRSGYECMPQYISDEIGPFGRNLPATRTVREAVRDAGFETLVVAAGGIHDFRQAEDILASGGADIVGSARQTLADPDWFLKTRLGCGDDIRVCMYTNYCEALDTKHKQVTCELWDRESLDEPGIAKSIDGRRRLLPPAWRRDGAA
ncbi:MAG: NADH:flavin oxidoreductase [Gammaproteobacteria bacterium]|nr:NADH:flavin oxidoreductase [Gammaproteobacteria bacterium]